MTIGDAYARPIVDHLEQVGTEGLRPATTAHLRVRRGDPVPSVKDSLVALLPDVVVLDGFGASETGGQGRWWARTSDGAPVFAMDPSNVVIADDGTLCVPGDGRMGMLATSGHIPLRYHKDEAKTEATFPVVDGVRYAVPGDLAKVLADGTIAVYGRGRCRSTPAAKRSSPRRSSGRSRATRRCSTPRGGHAERALGLPGHRRGAAAARTRVPPGPRTCASTAAPTWPATSCPVPWCSWTPCGGRRPASPTTAGRRTWPMAALEGSLTTG